MCKTRLESEPELHMLPTTCLLWLLKVLNLFTLSLSPLSFVLWSSPAVQPVSNVSDIRCFLSSVVRVSQNQHATDQHSLPQTAPQHHASLLTDQGIQLSNGMTDVKWNYGFVMHSPSLSQMNVMTVKSSSLPPPSSQQSHPTDKHHDNGNSPRTLQRQRWHKTFGSD